MFDDAEIAGIRQRLLEKRQTLLELKDTGDQAAGTVELDQSSVGRLSRMDALQGQAMSQERARRRALELQQIEGALARIEAGDYGYCVRCDEPIARERLEFDPAVPLCIRCASEMD